MSNPAPQPGCGCPATPCPSPVTTAIPGPPGQNGVSPFTTTTAPFTVPTAAITPVTVTVGNTSWMIANMTLFIGHYPTPGSGTAGYYQVFQVLSPTTVSLINLGYSTNDGVGTVEPSGLAVTPTGAQGVSAGLNGIGGIGLTNTKGQMLVDNGAGHPATPSLQPVSVGTNGQVLTAQSANAEGVVWQGIDLTGATTALSGQLPIASGGTGASTAATALNALMPASPAAGDVVYFNGTSWVRLPIGTISHQLLRTNSGLTAPEWALQGVLQAIKKLVAPTSSTISSATGLAFGNSAPSTSTGVLAVTQGVTPVSASSVLRVACNLTITTTTGGYMALFNGSTLLAIVATSLAGTQTLQLLHEFAPGSTSALTLNVYVGNNGNSDNVYVGGNGSYHNLYGSGTNIGCLTVEEMIGV